MYRQWNGNLFAATVYVRRRFAVSRRITRTRLCERPQSHGPRTPINNRVGRRRVSMNDSNGPFSQ